MQFATDAGRQLQELYAGSTLVRFEYHHYAFLGQESLRAAEAAECANDQGMFWQYHDTLFLNQIAENAGFWSEQFLIQMAVQLTLNEVEFTSCLTSGKYQSAVVAASQEARDRGVTGTPTLFINGERIQLGSVNSYIQIINTALGR